MEELELSWVSLSYLEMCNRKNYIPEWISLSKVTERKLPDYVLGDNTAFNISAMLLEEESPIVNALTI